MRETIIVIDDDEKITSMLKRALAFEGYSVLIANDGAEGLKILLAQVPNLIILDVMMPKIDGFEVCRRIRESGSDVPILMLTARDEISDRVQGLDLGADDYLVKPFALEELLARVRVLLRRRTESANKQATILTYEDLSLNVETREVFRGEHAIELTAKEFDLLQLFLQNPRHVLSKDSIMEKIWGIDFSGESNVLEVYIAMLRQKTEEFGHKRLIQTVRGAGYVLRGES